MNQKEMCEWLGVPAGTPVPRKIAETLGALPAGSAQAEALSACLAWTPPRMPLPPAQPALFNESTRTWAGFSF